jgi:hypothetical protein
MKPRHSQTNKAAIQVICLVSKLRPHALVLPHRSDDCSCTSRAQEEDPAKTM